METDKLPLARFEGVVIYPDPDGVFEVRYPLNWHKFDVTHQKGGILFSPYPDRSNAWVGVWKEALPRPAYATDVALLRQGLDEGIQRLGDLVEVLHKSEEIIGNLIRFERIVKFTDKGADLKRRHWLFYADKYQINLVYQALEDEYQRWSGMAYYSFHTFRLPEHLWFATDPDYVESLKKARKGGGQKAKAHRKRDNKSSGLSNK